MPISAPLKEILAYLQTHVTDDDCWFSSKAGKMGPGRGLNTTFRILTQNSPRGCRCLPHAHKRKPKRKHEFSCCRQSHSYYPPLTLLSNMGSYSVKNSEISLSHANTDQILGLGFQNQSKHNGQISLTSYVLFNQSGLGQGFSGHLK